MWTGHRHYARHQHFHQAGRRVARHRCHLRLSASARVTFSASTYLHDLRRPDCHGTVLQYRTLSDVRPASEAHDDVVPR